MKKEPRVWVLYAPPHVGKSTAVTHVLHNLHQQGKVNVPELEVSLFNKLILKHGGDKCLDLDDWLQQAMGCAKPQQHRPFSWLPRAAPLCYPGRSIGNHHQESP